MAATSRYANGTAAAKHAEAPYLREALERAVAEDLLMDTPLTMDLVEVAGFARKSAVEGGQER